MPITSADLKIFGSQKLTEDADAGGRRGGLALQDGVSNNLFPDVSPTDRVAGRVHLRKVYPTVVSNERDALLGAHVLLTEQPTDAAIDVVAFRFGDHKTLRSAAEVNLGTAAPFAVVPNSTYFALLTSLPDGEINYLVGAEAGDILAMYTSGGVSDVVAVIRLTGLVSAGPPSVYSYVVQFGVVPNKIDWLNFHLWRYAPATPAQAATSPGAYASPVGFASLTSAAAANDVEVDVSRVMARWNPSTAGFYKGLLPIFRPGGIVYVEHATVPATKEIAVVDRVLFDGRLKLTAGLTNAYPVGSKVCALLQCGDLQASVGVSFSQQTWTRVFSDTPIGNSISAQYNRAIADIAITNEGAATERWAIVFTSNTAFRLIGESVGQIATGDIGTSFSPLNPFTNQPYFTIPTGGWGTGWGIGNVLRFNTVAAEAPVWVARCVSPSSPGGTVQTEMTVRGAVNA